MRWSTILEGIHQETKLLLSAFWCEAQNLKHLCLKLRVVDTDGTATHFDTVTNHVVSISTHGSRVCVEQGDVLIHRMGEWVVHRHEALLLIAPFKHREFCHPQEGKLILIAKSETLTHFETQFAQLLASLHGILTREDENQIAWLGIHLLFQCIELLGSVELIHARLHAAVFLHACINQTLRTNLRTLHEVGQLVKLLTGIYSTTWCADTADVGSIVEHREGAALQRVHQFHELHAEAHIWLVRTESAHRFSPRQTKEWLVDFHASECLEQMLCHALESLDDVLLRDKRHLAVNLSEFRLTVGTQVFIAETLHDLEITVETCHHQQLLQGLRALRKCIELTWVHTGRHHEVASTLRSGTNEHRCFHLEETEVGEVVAHLDAHPVAQFEVLAHT